MTKQQETIYALSSTPGRSALSIIRVTGQDTFLIIEKITKNNIKEIILKYPFENAKRYLADVCRCVLLQSQDCTAYVFCVECCQILST